MKGIYKNVVSKSVQIKTNRFLRSILGDVKYLKLQRLLGAGALQSKVTNTGLCFIHVPKVAGTAIVRTIFDVRGVGHFKASAIERADKSYFQNSFKFALYRDPVERLYSAFCFYRQGGTDDVHVIRDDSVIEEFESFDKFVKNWLVKQNLQYLDYVFQPQHHFVTNSNGELLVDKLYDLRNIDVLEKDISERLNRKILIPKLNKTNKRLPVISQETKILIRKIYEKDYLLEGKTS